MRFLFLLCFSLQFTTGFAATVTVSNTNNSGAGSLRNAISTAASGDTINFSVSGTITMSSDNYATITQNNLTIDGGNAITIDGGGAFRPFLVSGTGVVIENMSLQNCKAQGGTGGTAGGGGGAGLGGAIFVNNLASVTLENLTFASSNQATGGSGGPSQAATFAGGGGGGGLGGNGATFAFSDTGGGGGGVLPSNDATSGTGSGGGGNGSTVFVYNGSGGLDFGGGGGGGADNFTQNAGFGGAGGFGGGGGASGGAGSVAGANAGGGNGGFGAGGGAGWYGTFAAGTGGLGGGAGSDGAMTVRGAGGGGAALGGQIFIRSGGTAVVNGTVGAGTVTAGAGGANTGGGSSGQDGQAFGGGIFINGTTTLNIGGASGTYVISGAIADDQSLTQGSGTKGAGSVTKIGANQITLSGVNTYTGSTTVSQGTLVVTGQISASSTTTVASGATLKGTGIIGPLVVNGILQPGTSIGTLNVVGPYNQANDTTLTIEFNGTTTSKVSVTGSATIGTNVTLNLLPQADTYTNGQSYLFLETTTGITGTFSQITYANSNLGGFTASLLPSDGTTMSFILSSPPVPSISVSPLSNQQKVPIYLTSSLALGLGRFQNSFITQIQNQRYSLEKICCCNFTTGAELCERCGGEGRICDAQKTYHPYAMFDYGNLDPIATSYTTQASQQFWSALLGTDFYIHRRFILGLAAGYTRGDADASSSNQGQIDCNHITANGYFQYNPFSTVYVDGSFIYGFSDFKSKRDLGGKIHGKFDGYDLSSQLRLLYQGCYKQLWARPYMGATYFLNQTDGYEETGSSSNLLSISQDQFDAVALEWGLNLWAPFKFTHWTLTPQCAFSYSKAVYNPLHHVDAGTLSSGTRGTSIALANISDEWWSVEGGVSAIFGNCTDLFFNFSFLFDENYETSEEFSFGIETAF